MSFAHAYVAIRDFHSDDGPEVVDPVWEKRVVQGTLSSGVGEPRVWSRRTGWVMLTRPGAVLATLFIAPIVGPPDRGLFALFGTQADLETIASGNDEVMPAREMFRREAEAQARKMRRAWSTWIVDDDSGTEVRRTILAPGELLPAALPSQAQPFGPSSVTKLYRPALLATLSGQSLTMTLEDEPDRNP